MTTPKKKAGEDERMLPVAKSLFYAWVSQLPADGNFDAQCEAFANRAWRAAGHFNDARNRWAAKYGSSSPRVPVNGIIAAYHEHFPAGPRIENKPTTKLTALIAKHWKEGGMDVARWTQVFARAHTSPFLTGRTREQHRPPDIIWLMANAGMIESGRYDERKPNGMERGPENPFAFGNRDSR